MAKCEKCGKSEHEVRLVEAISGPEITKICTQCARKENIPIIKKPTTRQLKKSEKKRGAYERLKEISGHKDREDKVKKVAEKISKVDKDEDGPMPMTEKQVENMDLIDNYNWHISMARKKRKMTRRKLAKEIGESEVAIKMIENGRPPQDALKLVKKLEQYFGIDLREGDGEEERKQRRKQLEKLRERRSSKELREIGKSIESKEKGKSREYRKEVKRKEIKEQAKQQDRRSGKGVKLIGKEETEKEDQREGREESKQKKNKEEGKISIKKPAHVSLDDLRQKGKEEKQKKSKDRDKKRVKKKSEPTAAEKKAQDLIKQVEKEKKEREKKRKEKAKEIQNEEDGSMLGEVDLEE